MTLHISSVFTYDEDAGTYIQAVETADGQALESATRQAINNFVIGCKQDGIWDAIKASCILAGARTLSGALVPLKGTAPTNVAGGFVSGDYTRGGATPGLQGDETSYLDSGRANNDDPQNDNHVSAYMTVAITTPTGNIWGSDGVIVSGGNNIYRSPTGPDLDGANRGTGSGIAFSIPGGAAIAGFKGYSRADSTGYTVRSAGANTLVTSTSNAPTARNVFFFARNDASSPPQFVSDPRLAFYSIGESLDLAKLDGRVTDLITAFGAAIP